MSKEHGFFCAVAVINRVSRSAIGSRSAGKKSAAKHFDDARRSRGSDHSRLREVELPESAHRTFDECQRRELGACMAVGPRRRDGDDCRGFVFDDATEAQANRLDAARSGGSSKSAGDRLRIVPRRSAARSLTSTRADARHWISPGARKLEAGAQLRRLSGRGSRIENGRCRGHRPTESDLARRPDLAVTPRMTHVSRTTPQIPFPGVARSGGQPPRRHDRTERARRMRVGAARIRAQQAWIHTNAEFA